MERVKGPATSETGAEVDIPFYGVSADVLFTLGTARGIEEFYVDGVLAGEVDTYSHNKHNRAVIFATGNLDVRAHGIRIKDTGRANPAAPPDYAWTGFDAVHVTAFSAPTGAA